MQSSTHIGNKTSRGESGGVLGVLLTTVTLIILFGSFGTGIFFLVKGISQDDDRLPQKSAARTKAEPQHPTGHDRPAGPTTQPQTRPFNGHQVAPPPDRRRTPSNSSGTNFIVRWLSSDQNGTTRRTTSPAPPKPRPPVNVEPEWALTEAPGIPTGENWTLPTTLQDWQERGRIHVELSQVQLVERFSTLPPFSLDYDRVAITVAGNFPETFEFLQVVESEIPLAVVQELNWTDLGRHQIELRAVFDLPRLRRIEQIPRDQQKELLKTIRTIQSIRWVAPTPANNLFDLPQVNADGHANPGRVVRLPLSENLARQHVILSGIIGEGKNGMAILNDRIHRIDENLVVTIKGRTHSARLVEILSRPARVKLDNGQESFLIFALLR